ncbi:hypothetical protein [Streptococcus pantholopis]
MASDAGITLTAIFFTRILGRVQFNKIQSLLDNKQQRAFLRCSGKEHLCGYFKFFPLLIAAKRKISQ